MAICGSGCVHVNRKEPETIPQKRVDGILLFTYNTDGTYVILPGLNK